VSSALIEAHAKMLLQLLKSVVTERYKRMAKEEVLSRFMAQNLDPVLLIDLHMRMERDAVQLTEVSLLELVSSDRMINELKKSSVRIQAAYQEIYGEDVVENFSHPHLIELRQRCFQKRIEFYNSFLTVNRSCANSLEMGAQAFNKAERFQKKLSNVFDVDRSYADELVRQTHTTYRFLMRRQTDYEILKSEEIWLEYKTEAFKEPQALP
jgi:hypothetical protein